MSEGDRVTRVAGDLFDSAAAEAQRTSRSTKAQLDYWTRIGRAVTSQQSIPHDRVEAALRGELALSALTPEEGVVFNAETSARIAQSLEAVDFRERLAGEGYDSAVEKRSARRRRPEWADEVEMASDRSSIDADDPVQAQGLAFAAAVSVAVVNYRVEHGLNQTQFAHQMGWKPTRVARLERGDTQPRLETLERLARAGVLRVHIDRRGPVVLWTEMSTQNVLALPVQLRPQFQQLEELLQLWSILRRGTDELAALIWLFAPTNALRFTSTARVFTRRNWSPAEFAALKTEAERHVAWWLQ